MNTKKIEKIDLTPKTAYLTGVIIGDGNLSSSVKSKTDLSKDYRMYIDISDREYLIYLSRLIKSIIKTKTNPKQPSKRGNRIPRLYLQIRNKDLFYFFYKEMEIPRGKKSSIVFVPSKINNSSKEKKVNVVISFLAMLELVKQGAISVKQDSQFGDIDMDTQEVSIPNYMERI